VSSITYCKGDKGYVVSTVQHYIITLL
jgi:hypothetical protein